MREFSNAAWNEMRLVPETGDLKQYEISTHYSYAQFQITEYKKHSDGHWTGHDTFFSAWEDVKTHFNEETNLSNFDELGRDLEISLGIELLARELS